MQLLRGPGGPGACLLLRAQPRHLCSPPGPRVLHYQFPRGSPELFNPGRVTPSTSAGRKVGHSAQMWKMCFCFCFFLFFIPRGYSPPEGNWQVFVGDCVGLHLGADGLMGMASGAPSSPCFASHHLCPGLPLCHQPHPPQHTPGRPAFSAHFLATSAGQTPDPSPPPMSLLSCAPVSCFCPRQVDTSPSFCICCILNLNPPRLQTRHLAQCAGASEETRWAVSKPRPCIQRVAVQRVWGGVKRRVVRSGGNVGGRGEGGEEGRGVGSRGQERGVCARRLRAGVLNHVCIRERLAAAGPVPRRHCRRYVVPAVFSQV